MTTALAGSRGSRSFGLQRFVPVIPAAFLTVVGTGLGLATTSPALAQAALALGAAALLVAACIVAPRRAVIGLVAWLTVFATARRVLLKAGAGGDNDLLLLVAPIAVVVLVVVAGRRGAFRSRTPLTTSVLVLSGLVMMSALNPLQGGLSVGAGGLLFVLVPLLWFWVGRAVVDDRLLRQLLRAISGLALAAAAYGLFQVYQGFPVWDARWIELKGYVALQVGESLRPFSSFASNAEYVSFLGVAATVWVARFRRGTRTLCIGAALALLSWALVVASLRSVLVLLPVAFGVMFAAARGFGVGRTALGGLAGLLVLGAAVTALDPSAVGGDRTSALLSRQVEGLSDPLNPAVSTLPAHFEQLMSGVGQAISNPAGQGVGAVTLAGSRFGAETRAGTEADPSNAAVALGLPGLVSYCLIVALGFRVAFRTARSRRDVLSLAALGILVVTSLQWLNGGAYAVAPLPWLVLGWLDRHSLEAPSASSLDPR